MLTCMALRYQIYLEAVMRWDRVSTGRLLESFHPLDTVAYKRCQMK